MVVETSHIDGWIASKKGFGLLMMMNSEMRTTATSALPLRLSTNHRHRRWCRCRCPLRRYLASPVAERRFSQS